MSEVWWPTVAHPVLSVTFTGHEITAVRHAVIRQAADVGLRGDRLHDFVFAVNEIVTDAVTRGAGCGELRLWVQGQTVGCEVTEVNPGSTSSGRGAPANGGRPSGFDGLVLQLARTLVDSLDVSDSSAGTAIRLVTTLPVPV